MHLKLQRYCRLSKGKWALFPRLRRVLLSALFHLSLHGQPTICIRKPQGLYPMPKCIAALSRVLGSLASFHVLRSLSQRENLFSCPCLLPVDLSSSLALAAYRVLPLACIILYKSCHDRLPSYLLFTTCWHIHGFQPQHSWYFRNSLDLHFCTHTLHLVCSTP